MRSRASRRYSKKDLTPGPAPARDQPFAVGVVVVRQLLAPADPPRRANPDRAVDDVDVAVGAAGVVDEARVVAADAGVNHRAVRELEAPDVAVADVAPLAPEALLVRDLLAGVVDDPSVLRNQLCSVDAPSCNSRTQLFDYVLKGILDLTLTV